MNNVVKSQKKAAGIHRQKSIVREMKRLLKAASILATPLPNINRKAATPIDKTRDRHLAHAWRQHAALLNAADAMERMQRHIGVGPTKNSDSLSDLMAKDRKFRSRVEQILLPSLRAQSRQVVKSILDKKSTSTFQATGAFSWQDKARLFKLSADAFEYSVATGAVYPMNAQGDAPDEDPDDSVPSSPGQAVSAGRTDDSLNKLIEWLIRAIESLGNAIIDWLNATDDDYARNEINGLKCADIKAKSDAYWIEKFGHLIDGPTGDDDELAMLKVLKCLPASRVVTIVHHFGLEDFMDEFQGAEWDTLVVRLRECGLLSFADWDDDASRLFITKNKKSTLAQLSITDIVQLCHNLFSGSCGDDDEKAIIRLISSQDLCKVKTILSIPYISFEEFDDNVDGEEWDKLSAILVKAYFYTPYC